MKSRTTKIATLVGAMALAGAISVPTTASAQDADDKPATSFSVFLRLQAELVNASGDLPESKGNDGLQFGDGWREGASDSGGWGGLFFNLSHQLTDDTKAIARYSRNIDTDETKGTRDVWVGIESKAFGRLTAGKHHSVYKLATLRDDPFNATFLQARRNQGRSGRIFGHDGFIEDSINYQKTVNGFKFAGMIGIEDGDIAGSGDDGDHLLAASVTAPVGPVNLIVAYQDASNYGSRGDDATGLKFAANYSQGPLTLAGAYEFRDEGLEDGDFALISASYKAGKWKHSVNVGRFMDDRDSRDSDGTYFAIGTRYTWTRTVALHFGYKRSNDGIIGGGGSAFDGDDSVFGIGLRVALNTGNLLAR